MKQIELTKNRVAIVDDELFDEINAMKWFATGSKKHTYAGRNDGNGGMITMHCYIAKPRKDERVLHINGNTLDNRRENLKVVRKLKYKGTLYYKTCRSKPWGAQIRIDGKHVFLGTFKTAKEAGEAYVKARAERDAKKPKKHKPTKAEKAVQRAQNRLERAKLALELAQANLQAEAPQVQ